MVILGCRVPRACQALAKHFLPCYLTLTHGISPVHCLRLSAQGFKCDKAKEEDSSRDKVVLPSRQKARKEDGAQRESLVFKEKPALELSMVGMLTDRE